MDMLHVFLVFLRVFSALNLGRVETHCGQGRIRRAGERAFVPPHQNMTRGNYSEHAINSLS